jgi:hypothetical protein
MGPRALGLAAALLLLGSAPLAGQDVPADSLPAPVISLADTTEPEVRPSEPIPLDTLAFGLAPGDTIPVLAQRFREGRGPEELAAVPSEDVRVKNPRNAAIRAFLVPGWGQVYTGHPWRAVLFAGGEALFFTMGYVRQQDVVEKKREIAAARAAYLANPPEGSPTDSLALEDAFLRTQVFLDLDNDREILRERRQDWYAWGIASVIFAAVDAYVAAQLDPVEVELSPAGELRVGVELPIGGPARPRRR